MANFTDTRSFAILTKEMRKVNLTKEELTELHLKYYDTKSSVLKNKLVTYHMRYLITVVNGFKTSKNVSFEDLIGYGSIGLVRALDTFNPHEGYTFVTYAKTCIQRSIVASIQHEDMIRMKGVDKRLIKDGELPTYSYASTDDMLSHSKDSDTIGNMLVGDAFDNLFIFDEKTEDERIKEFWEYVDKLITIPQHREIARAVYSANTTTGEMIKLTETEIADIYGTTKQNIGQKKRVIWNKLRQDPKLRQWWEENFLKKD